MSVAVSRGGRGAAVSPWDSQASSTPNWLWVVREEREGAPGAQHSCVFLRLIREQLLEGDFTVNMRLLQVTEFGGTGSVLGCETDP